MKQLLNIFCIGASIATILATYGKIQIIRSDHEFETISTKKNKALITFTAPWCTACNAIKKPLEDISQENAFADITFASVDVDKHPQLAYNNSVIGVPTFSYLENGHKKQHDVGIHNSATFKQEIRNTLQKLFKKPDKKSVLLAAFTAKKPSHNSATIQQDTTKSVVPADTQEQSTPTKKSFWDALKDIISWFFKAIKRLIDTIVTPIKK